jgi:hypothetical protein
MKDSRSVGEQFVEGVIIAGIALASKAAGLFTPGSKRNYPVLVLAAAVLIAVFIYPWVRQGQDKKLPNVLTSKQVTGTAFVLIGLALAVKIAVDAFWGKVPEYSFLLMGLGAMVVLFLLPLARSRKG